VFHFFASLVSSKKGVVAVLLLWILMAGTINLVAPPLSEVITNEQEEFLPGGAEAVRALALTIEKFPSQQGTPAILVFHDASGLNSQGIAAIQQVERRLKSEDAPRELGGVLSPFSMPPDELVSWDVPVSHHTKHFVLLLAKAHAGEGKLGF